MIHKWICSKCGLLNDIGLIRCRNCKESKIKAIACVHFNDMNHMKRWIKLMKDNMGAKVWWSP